MRVTRKDGQVTLTHLGVSVSTPDNGIDKKAAMNILTDKWRRARKSKKSARFEHSVLPKGFRL